MLNRVKYIAVKITLFIIPVFLIILPIDFFDNGNSICLSILFFDQSCVGCGMTRAIMHLIHLDFAGAAEYNKISFIVFPLLLLIYIKMISFYFFNKRIMKWL